MGNIRKQRLIIDGLAISTPRMSGIGHTLLSLIEALIQNSDFTRDFDITIIVPKANLEFIRAHNLPHVSFRAVPLPWRVMNRLPTLWLPPIDIFFGKGIYLFGNYSSWPLRRSASLTFVYDAVCYRYPQFLTPRHRSMLRRNLPRWTAQSTSVAVISEAMRADVTKFLDLPDKKIVTIPCGVDIKQFYPRCAAEISRVGAAYSLPTKYILALGNIDPRKNLIRLIEAYGGLSSYLLRRHPLVLVGGSAWLTDGLDDAIKRVEALGGTVVRVEAYVPDADLPALISGAYALAYPSQYEGFGIPPLQAMACGVPVLAGNNSAMPEVCGDAAVLVDVLDTRAITTGLERLLIDNALRQNLIQKGSNRVHTYTWGRAAERLKVEITRLANNV